MSVANGVPWESSALTPGAVDAATWLQPYEASGWARALPVLGAAPALLALLGCVVGVGVPIALHFHHVEGRTFRGVGPLGQLLAVGGLTAALVFTMAIVGLRAGGDGGLGASAAYGLSRALAEAERLGELATSLNASGAALASEIGRLRHSCPQQVETVLGGSLAETQGQVESFVANIGNFSGFVVVLPEQLQQVAGGEAVAGASLGGCLALSALAAACAAGAVAAAVADLHFNGGALQRRLGQYSRWELPAIAMLGGLASVVVALSAAAEASVGAAAGAACGDIDASVVQSTGETLGLSSSAYALARFYIAGLGRHPALADVALAKASVMACLQWVERYQWVVAESCPGWTSADMASALDAASGRLNETEALLSPAYVYPVYQAVVRESICGETLPALGWLVLLQALLGLVCLPVLSVLGSIFLRTVAEGRQFSRLCQEEHDVEGGVEQDFNPLYYAVYAFAIFEFIVGAVMYLAPNPSVVGRIVGTMLYGIGFFLMTNSDLIVTYFRMRYQRDRLRRNNAAFAKSVTEQASVLRELSMTAQSLDMINKRFGGDVRRAVKDVDRLSDVVKSDIRMACKSLVRLYLDKDASHVIASGAQLDQAFDLIQLVFGGVFRKDFDERAAALKEALGSSAKVRADRGIAEGKFAELQAMTLVEPDTRRIRDIAQRLLDGAASASKPG